MYRPAALPLRLLHSYKPASYRPLRPLQSVQLRSSLPAAKTDSAASKLLQSFEQHIRSIAWLIKELDAAKCPHMLFGATAALAQGAKVDPASLPHVSAEVQWDFLATLHSCTFISLAASPVQRVPAGQQFTMERHGIVFQISCRLNTVLAMDPDRVKVIPSWGASAPVKQLQEEEGQVWCQSLLSVRQELLLQQQEACRLQQSQQDQQRRHHRQQGLRQQGDYGDNQQHHTQQRREEDHNNHRNHHQQQQELVQSLAQQDQQQQGHQLLLQAIELRLSEMQEEFSRANTEAWAQDETFNAWVARFGSPADAAARIAADPVLRLIPLTRHLPTNMNGCRVVNLMGSNGTKAVALALLGAKVTVVDVSPGNAEYARQLAAAAGVEIHYEVCDVLHMPSHLLSGGFDVVLLELGVLHYFIDLKPLMDVVQQLLAPGGRLLLREFHPVSTKLITSRGKKHKVTGNYFNQGYAGSSVAYSKHQSSVKAGSTEAAAVQLRQWTLGEVVTAVCTAGLRMASLVEEQGSKLDDIGIPKLYTLVATKG